MWSVVTPAQTRAAALVLADSDAESVWLWEAVLDPRTCPICRPLDGTRAASPEEFPEGPPPLHPLCRCIVVPLFT
ncbi:MAG: phage minor head protein [Candidatus Limnocylindrus sp.]